MGEESEFPTVGEIVVVKISKVLDYGAFAELLEYDNIKGFIHISQVASGWVKNIRNFVKERQVRAAKVQSVNSVKKQIDLSLTKVSAAAQREKINQFKQLKRERKLIETLAKRQRSSFEEAWDAIAEPLIRKYGSLVKAFKQIALRGKNAAEGIPPKWVSPLVEMVEKSVTVPTRTVKGVLKLRVVSPDGVIIIKEALSKGVAPSKETAIDIFYLGSGRYLLKASSHDFKVAEKAMNSAANRVLEFIKSHKGEVGFERVDEK